MLNYNNEQYATVIDYYNSQMMPLIDDMIESMIRKLESFNASVDD